MLFPLRSCQQNLKCKYDFNYLANYLLHRKNFRDVMELLRYDFNSSSSDGSSDDDDLDLILYDIAFTPKRKLGSRLNLQDITEDDCEKMFRYKSPMFIERV